jgi:hypothetical protein
MGSFREGSEVYGEYGVFICFQREITIREVGITGFRDYELGILGVRKISDE